MRTATCNLCNAKVIVDCKVLRSCDGLSGIRRKLVVVVQAKSPDTSLSKLDPSYRIKIMCESNHLTFGQFSPFQDEDEGLISE